MNPVGIDVSKGRSMVAVLQRLSVIVDKPYVVHHTVSELEKLAYYLKSLDGETRVIMEHTGRYYEPVAQALHELVVFVSAVNPLSGQFPGRYIYDFVLDLLWQVCNSTNLNIL